VPRQVESSPPRPAPKCGLSSPGRGCPDCRPAPGPA